VLRPLADADLPLIFELQRDPESVAMARVPARDREAFDANWERIRANEETTVRVVDDGTGGVAGWLLVFPLDGELCLGYWIAREHWGRGLATRAVSELLGEVEARPLHATVATGNAASRRVLEKCGFTDLGPTSEWDDRLGERVAIHRYELG
jgi:RimJ/RimL family protein N-acetyltransferase